ncbi:MAG: GNAT family N-acetyltransferase [Eubacteriales bacterium]|nr:GNAT family N-acetyltransferase [Eubacteriales bacterium]
MAEQYISDAEIPVITYTNNITVENYNALRRAVNWIKVTEKRASIALRHSFYLCVAVCEGKPVGMARIVSDGGYTYFITDVIVHPDYQGYHIGTELISRVLDYIEKDVVDGETVMVSLMAAYDRESFYERFGFHTRPFGNHGPGMSMWVSRDVTGKVITA